CAGVRAAAGSAAGGGTGSGGSLSPVRALGTDGGVGGDHRKRGDSREQRSRQTITDGNWGTREPPSFARGEAGERETTEMCHALVTRSRVPAIPRPRSFAVLTVPRALDQRAMPS